MDLKVIEKTTTALKSAREALAEAVEGRAALDCSGHQTQIRVYIGQRGFSLTEFDRGYTSKVIRGHEMIALGCVKVMNGVIEEKRLMVAEIERELRRLTGAADGNS